MVKKWISGREVTQWQSSGSVVEKCLSGKVVAQ